MIFKIFVLLSILCWTRADDIFPPFNPIYGYPEMTIKDLLIEFNTLKVIINNDFNKLQDAIEAISSRCVPVTLNHCEKCQDSASLIDIRIDVLSQQPIWDSKPTVIDGTSFSNTNQSVPVTLSHCEKCQDHSNLIDVRSDVLGQQPTVVDGTGFSNSIQPPCTACYTTTAIEAESNSNNTNQQYCPAGCVPTSTAEGTKNCSIAITTADGTSSSIATTTADRTTSSSPPKTTANEIAGSSIATTTPADGKRTITADRISSTVADTDSSIASKPTSTAVDFIPSSCEEVLRLSGRPNELHQIRIQNSQTKPFFVNCLVDPNGDGGAWTIIQRRIDGSIDFFRNWKDYKQGFGNFETEFFIGLDKLHALTNSGKHELWIEMEDFERSRRHAMYSSFGIGDESQAYTLIMLGNYTGNAGDSLTPHAGEKFTTMDVDNDSHDKMNCAVQYEGAWWYKKCHHSNLNGKYLSGAYPKLQYGKGIDWYTWHNHNYSVKYVHMAIRPVNLKI